MLRFSRSFPYVVHLAVLGLYAATVGSALGLVLFGSLTFGKGLGDLPFFLLHLVFYLLLLALGWVSRATREPILTGLLAGAMLGQLVFMALQLTLWRGSEYQWNQRIFLRAPPWASCRSTSAGGVLQGNAEGRARTEAENELSQTLTPTPTPTDS